MNETLDLSPGQAQCITQEDVHIHLDEYDEELSELRTGLNTIDNTQHYEEVLLFNSFRREDPSISLAEQVHRFEGAMSKLPSRSIDLPADTEQGDFRDLPRSLLTAERVDEDQSQKLQGNMGEAGWETCGEDTRQDQQQQERPKSGQYSNLTGKNALSKAKAQIEGFWQCENPSVRLDRASDSSWQRTDIKIADRSSSMPVQASIQEQVKDCDKSLKKRSQKEVTKSSEGSNCAAPTSTGSGRWNGPYLDRLLNDTGRSAEVTSTPT